jgi:hypothetical protein
MLDRSGSMYAFNVGLDKLRSTIVVCDAREEEEEEDSVVAITLNARVIKPATAAITMTTVAASTREEGRRGEIFSLFLFLLLPIPFLIS